LFADDTNLFVSGQSIGEVTAIANTCISKLNTWFLANKLSLNLDKTCFSAYKVLVTIYYAFVHSHLLYDIEIYGNTHHSYLNKLMVLNNKLLRILQNAPRNIPVVDLYKTF